MVYLNHMLTLGGLVVLLACGSFSFSTHAAPKLLGVDADQWAALNTSVGGRLRLSQPFELPCFTSFEGQSVSPDPVACATVQANYTDPVFRSEHFGTYMIVSSPSP